MAQLANECTPASNAPRLKLRLAAVGIWRRHALTRCRPYRPENGLANLRSRTRSSLGYNLAGFQPPPESASLFYRDVLFTNFIFL